LPKPSPTPPTEPSVRSAEKPLRSRAGCSLALPTPAIAVIVVLLLAVAGGCSATDERSTSASTSTTSSSSSTTAEPTTTTSAAAAGPLLVAAGDIACVPGMAARPTQCQQEATAALVESLHPDAVAALGDLQYDRGEAANFAGSYVPSWGRFLDRTHPAPGNHEYAGGRAAGYYGTFGGRADGVDGRGWYSYDLGTWHVVVLNSNCSAVGGCGPGSAELRWLHDDLAAHARPCTLAYWHHPRWSSGLHHSDDGYQPFWDELAAAGADVVLSGHDHHYERFAPVQGIRQFVVGTGGRSLYPVVSRESGSEVVDTHTFGVLALTLRDGGYDWRFDPIPGSTFTDAGSAGC
jgi:hypothetical protein